MGNAQEVKQTQGSQKGIAKQFILQTIKVVPGLSDVIFKYDGKEGKVFAISSKRVKRIKFKLPPDKFNAYVKMAIDEIITEVARKKGVSLEGLKDLDGGFSFVEGKQEYRFRVNVARHDEVGYVITMRWLKDHVWTVQDYFLTPFSINPLFKRLHSNLGGLYLVIGPTGSGKSTLTVAVLKEVLKFPFNIITLEDPIEYRIYPNVGEITQREVGIDTPSFSRGLKSAMRQNPNVIFVGEVRDEETVEALAQAADTGHVVIATLHTESPKDTLERLQGLVSENKMESIMRVIAKTLIGVLGVRMFNPPEGKKGKIILHEYLNAEDTAIRSLLLKREFNQIDSFQNSLDRGCITFAISAAYQLEYGLTPYAMEDYLSTGLFDKDDLRSAIQQVKKHKKELNPENLKIS